MIKKKRFSLVLIKPSHYDDDGYPHFDETEKLPELKPNEQQLLMKKAVIQYFIKFTYVFTYNCKLFFVSLSYLF